MDSPGEEFAYRYCAGDRVEQRRKRLNLDRARIPFNSCVSELMTADRHLHTDGCSLTRL